jgi:hypothetical protein
MTNHRISARLSVLLLLGAALGCRPRAQAPAAAPAPRERAGAKAMFTTLESARPEYWFSPIDLSTAVGPSPTLEVLVSHDSRSVGAATLNDLASSVSLRTWPELQEIPTTKAIKDATGAWGTEIFAHVTLTPAGALPDRWYAIYMASQPASVGLSMQGRVLASGDARVARFRVGSQPMLTGVMLYEVADKPGVYLQFSESVEVTPKLLQSVMVKNIRGAQSACSPPGKEIQRGQRIALKCPTFALDDIDELGVGALSGAATKADGARLDKVRIGASRASMIGCGTSCRYLSL